MGPPAEFLKDTDKHSELSASVVSPARLSETRFWQNEHLNWWADIWKEEKVWPRSNNSFWVQAVMKMHSSELGNKLWAISLWLPLGSNESSISACPYRNTHTHTHTPPRAEVLFILFLHLRCRFCIHSGLPGHTAGRWPGLEAQESQIYRKKMQLRKEVKLYKWAFKSCANSLRGSGRWREKPGASHGIEREIPTPQQRHTPPWF